MEIEANKTFRGKTPIHSHKFALNKPKIADVVTLAVIGTEVGPYPNLMQLIDLLKRIGV